jgi:tight adherence protein C
MTALLLGTGFGAGLWAVTVWLAPPRPALRTALARATTTPPPPSPRVDHAGWVSAVGRPFVGPLRALGLPGDRVTRDLAVVGRAVSVHVAEKAVLALAGLLAPFVLQFLLVLAGVQPGLVLPAVGGLVLAAAGFVLPDVRVRREAAENRTGFRHGLSCYLDLVAISLAGGAGVESALTDAARIGHGWAFHHIRRALTTARFTRGTPWAALRQLGEDLDIAELTELGASVELVGSEGAKVRASLAAKSAALRTRYLTHVEAAAQAASERMSMPVMLLFLGFLVFLGYPALTQVLNGL